jgi:FdhE protein
VTAEYVTTQAQLEQALASAETRLPPYRGILEFYAPVFRAQESAKKKTSPTPIPLPSDILEAKRRGGFPLVTPSEFSIDVDAACDLFHEIVSIARKMPGKWADFADALVTPLDAPPVDPVLFFEKFLSQEDAFFAETARRYGVDAGMLGFVVYHSVLPSLNRSAEQLAVYLDSAKPWEHGFCPICGSLPGLAAFENEGMRVFFCTFCVHKWPTQRLFCPYCGNRDSGRLQYFYSDAEPGYRVDVCDRCGKYLKSVDLRHISHPLYPPLECLTTLHLDIKAREAGYESAVPLPME